MVFNKKLLLLLFLVSNSLFYSLNAFLSYNLLINEEGQLVLILTGINVQALNKTQEQDIKQWKNLISKINNTKSTTLTDCFIETTPDELKKAERAKSVVGDRFLSGITLEATKLAIKFNNDKNSQIKFHATDIRSKDGKIINSVLSTYLSLLNDGKYTTDTDTLERFFKQVCHIDIKFTVKNYLDSLNYYSGIIKQYRNLWPKESYVYLILDNIEKKFKESIKKASLYLKQERPNRALTKAIINVLNLNLDLKRINNIKIDLLYNLDSLILAVELFHRVMLSNQSKQRVLIITGEWTKEHLIKALKQVGYKLIKSESIVKWDTLNNGTVDLDDNFIHNLLNINKIFFLAPLISDEVNDQSINRLLNSNTDLTEPNFCNLCNISDKEANLRKCPFCKRVYYCSDLCQDCDLIAHIDECNY